MRFAVGGSVCTIIGDGGDVGELVKVGGGATGEGCAGIEECDGGAIRETCGECVGGEYRGKLVEGCVAIGGACSELEKLDGGGCRRFGKGEV